MGMIKKLGKTATSIKNAVTPINLTNTYLSKKVDKNVLKDTAGTFIGGLSLIGLEGVSDLYANDPFGVRDIVSKGLEYLPDAWGIEDNVRHYLTMGGLQNNVLPHLYLQSGDFTNYLAIIGGVIAITSAGLLLSNSGRANPDDKLSDGDLKDVVRKNKVSSVLSALAIPNMGAKLAGVAAATLGSVYQGVLDEDGKKPVSAQRSRSGQNIEKPMSVNYEIRQSLMGAYRDIRNAFGYKPKHVGANDLTTKPLTPKEVEAALNGKTKPPEYVGANDVLYNKINDTMPKNGVFGADDTRYSIMNGTKTEKAKQFDGTPKSKVFEPDNTYLWKNSANLDDQLESMGFFR